MAEERAAAEPGPTPATPVPSVTDPDADTETWVGPVPASGSGSTARPSGFPLHGRHHHNRFIAEYTLLRAVFATVYGLLMILLTPDSWASPAFVPAFDTLPRWAWGLLFVVVGIAMWVTYVMGTLRAHLAANLVWLAGWLTWTCFLGFAVFDRDAPVGGPLVYGFVTLLSVVSTRDLLRGGVWKWS